MAACHDCNAASVGRADDPVFRNVLWVALWVNLAMFVVEIIAGYLGDSMSLQADALDFFGDAANYAISLLVLGMALQIRARAALIKGVTMGVIGLWVLGNALYRTYSGSEPEPMIMGGIALLALVANVSVAILLYRYREGDANMRSIWLCSRNDAIGNMAVLIAAASVATTATRWPDLTVAGIIAFLSLSSAYQIIRQSWREMSESSKTTQSCKVSNP